MLSLGKSTSRASRMSKRCGNKTVVRVAADPELSGRMSGVQKLLEEDIMACDATIGFFSAAARHKHWKLLVRPFPPAYISIHSGDKKINDLRAMLAKIPRLQCMLTKLASGNYGGLHGDVIDFIYWLFFKGLRYRVRSVSEHQYKLLGPFLRNVPHCPQPTVVFEVQRTKNVYQTYNNLFNHAAFFPGRMEYYYLMLSTSFDLYHMFSLVNEVDKDPYNPELKEQQPLRLLSLLTDALKKMDEQSLWSESEIASMCKCVGMAYVKHEDDVIKISDFQSDLRLKTLQVGDTGIAKLNYLVLYGSVENGKELAKHNFILENHFIIQSILNSRLCAAGFISIMCCFLYTSFA